MFGIDGDCIVYVFTGVAGDGVVKVFVDSISFCGGCFREKESDIIMINETTFQGNIFS